MKKILIYFTIVMTIACDKRPKECKEDGSHNGLEMNNRSSVRIYEYYYWNYPDTLIGEYNPVNDLSGGIQPGGASRRGIGRYECLENFFSDGKKEWVYVFNADSIEQIPWEVVRATGRGLLARIELSEEYFRANNWQIYYP
jgi:hypothetical protein